MLVPWGFKKLLKYISNRYGSPDIYVTENGFSVKGEWNMSIEAAVQDTPRIDYYQGYLNAMLEAVSEGVSVKAYMAWCK
jgi:beta-glucosidase